MLPALQTIADELRDERRGAFEEYRTLLGSAIDEGEDFDDVPELRRLLEDLGLTPAEAQADADKLIQARELAKRSANLTGLTERSEVASRIVADYAAETASEQKAIDRHLRTKLNANAGDYDAAQLRKGQLIVDRQPEHDRLNAEALRASSAAEAAKSAARELAALLRANPELLGEVSK